MTPEIEKRWGHLKLVLTEFAGASPQAEGWTDIKINRAQQDVDNYIEYVRESIRAVVDVNGNRKLTS